MTQTEKVLYHMEKRGSLTPLQAMDCYGIMRLAARIGELRRDGHDIASKPFRTPGGNSEPLSADPGAADDACPASIKT